MGIFILIFIILALSILLGIFYKKQNTGNNILFSQINEGKYPIRVNTVEWGIKGSALYAYDFGKLYSDGKVIILTDYEGMNLSSYNQNYNYIETYLLAKYKNIKGQRTDIFTNIFDIKSISINEKGDLILNGSLYSKHIFKKIGWYPSLNNSTIKIKKPHINFDFETIIEITKPKT